MAATHREQASAASGGSAMSDKQAFDGRPELREFIHENCGFVILFAENAQNFCAAADDVGLDYAIRKMIAHVRAIADTGKDLRAERERVLKIVETVE